MRFANRPHRYEREKTRTNNVGGVARKTGLLHAGKPRKVRIKNVRGIFVSIILVPGEQSNKRKEKAKVKSKTPSQ